MISKLLVMMASLLCSFPNLTKAQEIDLLIKGGHLIDPKMILMAK